MKQESKQILETEVIEEPDFLDGVQVCLINDPTCEACQ